MLPAILGGAALISGIGGMFGGKKKKAPDLGEAVGGMLGFGAGGMMGAVRRGVGLRGYRRRRRRRLTNQDVAELTMLKQVLGKTAAANALPFYLGRR